MVSRSSSIACGGTLSTNNIFWDEFAYGAWRATQELGCPQHAQVQRGRRGIVRWRQKRKDSRLRTGRRGESPVVPIETISPRATDSFFLYDRAAYLISCRSVRDRPRAFVGRDVIPIRPVTTR